MRRFKAWAVSAFALLMVIGIWSRLATLPQAPKLIGQAFATLSTLFKGVLK